MTTPTTIEELAAALQAVTRRALAGQAPTIDEIVDLSLAATILAEPAPRDTAEDDGGPNAELITR